MKPELSLAATGSLRSEAANAYARLNVCSDVVTVRTTSTSGISGTGLKKCRPTNRSARLVAAAISAIVRLDVFEAKMVPGPHSPSSSLKSAFFSARSSVLASITISDGFRSATEDLFGYVTHDRIVADAGGDLCDAAAHQAAAEHTNPLDVRHEFLSSWAWGGAEDSRTPCAPRRRSGRMSRATRPGWTTRGPPRARADRAPAPAPPARARWRRGTCERPRPLPSSCRCLATASLPERVRAAER